MKLFCVRHGETVFNLEGRIQGQLNSHLSPLGQRQCAAVADALAGEPIEAIIASPLERALESARCLSDKLRLPVQTDPRLMEINAGIFQGHTWAEINEKFPQEADLWRSQDPDFRIPQGESAPRRDAAGRRRLSRDS